MTIAIVPRLQAHPDARDVTASHPATEFEAACGGVAPANYTVIEFQHPDGSSPASAVVTEVVAPPTAGKVTHWKYVLLTSTAFGVGMALEYGEGWRQRSEHINASNGGLVGRGLKVGNWVPGFARAGAEVDMMIEVVGNHVVAYIVVDRQPRGLAFSLDLSARPEAISQLKPVVICYDETVKAEAAVIQFAPAMPSDEYKRRLEIINPEHPAGEYRIADQFPGVHFPEAKAKVCVTQQGDLSFHVFNSLRNGAKLQQGGAIVGVMPQAISTMMMPPREYQQAEQVVTEWIGSLRTWSFADNKLTLNDKTFPLITADHQFVTDNELF